MTTRILLAAILALAFTKHPTPCPNGWCSGPCWSQGDCGSGCTCAGRFGGTGRCVSTP